MASANQNFRIPSNDDHDRVSALFLGPKAENSEVLMNCFNLVVGEQARARINYFPNDPAFITASIKASPAYNAKVEQLFYELKKLLEGLGKFSIPFYSPRYSAHMSVDQSLPAILGYLSTMFYNPNNVAFEASPFTTLIELEVGKQLCDMLGYKTVEDDSDTPLSWAHITCDGTVANLESIWAARNLKFYSLSLRDAMAVGAPLHFIADSFSVETCNGTVKLLRNCDVWELLNLKVSSITEIPQRLYKEYRISSTYLDSVMKNYIIQSISKDTLMKKWGIQEQPVIFVPSTKHYSWPKGAAIAGVGSDNVINIPIDPDARMDMDVLKEQLIMLAKEKKRAVYEVVAVIGTTEEGAVDRLEEMAKIRDYVQTLGLSFVLHADAAWGGYFASMLVPEGLSDSPKNGDPSYVPHVGLRTDTEVQLRSLKYTDSITIDPHKAGYIPYPAGGLCYRDGRMRYLLTWTAPYLNGSADGESIGVYGVEGSKPGAAPCAVYLAHQVVGLGVDGHGTLLGEASFTCRRFASHWAAMSNKDTDFVVVPLNPLPAELEPNPTPEKIEAQKEYIRKNILPKENWELVEDEDAMTLLNKLGSDLNINAFACNFRYRDGRINTDIEEANYLNRRIFERLSVTSPDEDPLKIPFYITSTVFAQSDYGTCADHFKKRLGLEGNQDLFVLRNVVMSPFTTTRDFISDLAREFKKVLEEEVEHVRRRNEAKPTIHNFLIQGTDKLCFVHLPSFHMASGRRQFIFSADISESGLKHHKEAKRSEQAQSFLRNSKPLLIDDIVNGSSFEAEITFKESSVKIPVHVSNVEVIKKRSLDTEDLDASYPTLMPFYLYGTPVQMHIDHILLIAPNIQLSCGKLSGSLQGKLPAKELERGLIAVAGNVHERSMQPFPPMKDLDVQDNFFFSAGRTLEVTVYSDPFPTSTLDPIDLGKLKDIVAKGTLVLEDDIYIDSDRLNSEFEIAQSARLLFTPSGQMRQTTKVRWVEAVRAFTKS